MTTSSLESADRRTVIGPDGTRISVLLHPVPADVVETGPPVLLVHGLGSDAATNWVQAGWVRALHRVRRPAVSFDLRGHGHSDRPVDAERYRLALMVGDLTAVIDDVFGGGPEVPFDAIGYSLGARLLLEYVGSGPTPLRRLVLGGTAGQPQLQGIDLGAIDRAIREGTVADLAPGSETARIARTISALPTNDAVALTYLVRGLNADADTARRTPDPALRTLLGVGTNDPLHDRSQRWAGELPDAQFVSVPGRDHVSTVPSGVFRTVAMEFLTRP